MTVEVGEPSAGSLWRPVQFLGSKLRSLEFISTAIRRLQPDPVTIWEPFSGSSVVSQHLASRGHRVWAGDALASSATMASAMLGVGGSEHRDLLPFAKSVVATARSSAAPDWELWLAREHRALSEGNGARLIVESAAIPQRWRPAGANSNLTRIFAQAETDATEGRQSSTGVLSATYAGTYFGLRQALDLDALRAGIESLGEAPSSWTRAALLTALMHAASSAVFSPGKHFAQPHRVRDGKDLTFHAQRALQDRRVDVVASFLEAVYAINDSARPAAERHLAERRLVGDVTAEDLSGREVSIVYADPPYTAQQYSRFYHLLETLVGGVPPLLQHVRGEVTRGLYPNDRYLSPFSSRRQAPQAFRSLIRTANSAGASLLLSYSAARGDATGNARIVSLDEIITWMGEAYGMGAVSVETLDLRYRQFNSSRAEVAGRDDPEYLVIGDAHAR